MIKNTEILSMAEASKYLDKKDERGADALAFIKKFVKIDAKGAEEMKKKLKDLDLIKLRDEHIAKIIDMLPENSDELNKIFAGGSLDEDETKKILEIAKEFK